MTDYFYAYEEDIEIDNMPVITLEVLSTKETNGHDETLTQTIDSELNATKIDNIIEDTLENDDCNVKIENETSDVITQIADDGNNTIKSDHHEYMTRSDGSVVCKLCGEILQSRVHWYRHKYKLHVPLSPAELFQCDKCFVYFKSRKGYIGHFATRHADSLADYKPVLTNTQAEALKKELTATNASRTFTELKNNIDPETAIPKTTLPNHNNPAVISKFPTKLSSDQKRTSKSSNKGLENQQSKADQDEKRTKEERLVAEIIDRVRRECEAQGAGGPARRGYSRRTTVMNT